MSRIQDTFARLEKAGGETALVTFVTAGDPGVAHTVPAMHAMVTGGADILELGIPFSDPEAEGPAIQLANERALANGMTLNKVLAMVEEFRTKDSVTPVILMGYLNSVLAMPNFAERAKTAGVDGLIMVNLPPEESVELTADLAARNMDLIFLVSPTTTPDRAEYILSRCSGFVYYVSLKGITGSGNIQADEVAERVAALKAVSPLPVCVGFGIKDARTAAAVGAHADGIVVGSALVKLMGEYAEDVEQCCVKLQAAVKDLKQAVVD